MSFVGIAFETGLATTWRCCSGDGANMSCVNMPGTTLAAGTQYKLTVDSSVVGTLTCTVDAGTPIAVSKTTNLPSAAASLGVQALTASLDGASKNTNVARITIEQN